jgi:hypothetical protein
LDPYANLVFLVENDEMDAFHKRYYDAYNNQIGTCPPLKLSIFNLSFLKYHKIAQCTDVQEYRYFLRKLNYIK